MTTREEMLEFLELPDSSSENDILERIDDKLTYFQRLSENAPNDFLRKLHQKNVQKIKDLQQQLTHKPQPHVQASSHPSTNYVSLNTTAATNGSFGDTSANLRQAQNNKTAVAWLVRHTENLSAKTFPLYYGKNFIGRHPHPSLPTIIIEEDNYVSRMHCMLEVISIDPLQVVVCDNAIINNKPSKNGTYINGNDNRITKKVVLVENDTIQVGMTKFLIKLNNVPIKKMVKEVEESDYMKTVIIDIF